ncbi:PKD domain-containing protein [Kribbella amoyensis]|uniref:PKD domain-containing protein n=1 Tax=Kribbella amoyensis TaxID=996641 RepID=UPI00119EA6FB|nr:PKD domain-containing protein [Kribbella amoyensis]
MADAQRRTESRFNRKGQQNKAQVTKTAAAKEAKPERMTPRTLTKFTPSGDLRLNIGICGRVGPDGTTPGPTRCQPYEPDQPQEPTPTTAVVPRPRPEDVTWEQVLTASKAVAFPGLGVKVQPSGRTLVNLATIVYTDRGQVTMATVELLGFPVVVEATPVSYTWSFGDGKTLTTTTPGRPHPAKDITHKYLKRAAVSVRLTTNYAARFNVAGTGWQYVDGTVPITGPGTPLQVREAVPVLVEPSN